MFASLWIGIVLAGGQAGCTTTKKTTGTDVVETRRAVVPDADGVTRGLRNGDFYQIPKVPPPGARNTYNSVRVNGPYLAITFDDGPHPQNTPRLLSILKERNVKATFFVVGQLAKEYPQIIRRILAEGHEIGNHTMSHPAITSLSNDRLQREIGGTHQALVDIAGYHTRLFRPPGGATNANLKQRLYDEYGYCTIMWSVDPNDWKRPGVSVVTSRLVNGAHNGAILLCHDLHAPTVDAMPNTLDTLLTKGYRFVTVGQLLNMEMAQPAPVAMPGPDAPTPAPSQPAQTIAPALPAGATSFPKGQIPAPRSIPSEGAKLR